MTTKHLPTKKERRKIRSKYFNDMKPHIFDRLLVAIPYVLKGYQVGKNRYREWFVGESKDYGECWLCGEA